MRFKIITVMSLVLFLCLSRYSLFPDSGGSFGGFDDFSSDSDSGGGFDSFGSDSNWGSDSNYGSNYYGGSSILPNSWTIIIVIIIILILIVRSVNRGKLSKLQQAGSVLKYQVSFYGSAKEVQNELHILAQKAGRYTGKMRELMNEAVLLIKRNKLNIKYGNYSIFRGSSHEALEGMFRRMISEERAKYREELIRTNFRQQPVQRQFRGKDEAQFKVAECIVVTLIVVSKKAKYPKLPVDYSNMIMLLDEVAAITDNEFAGFEIIWTPENPEDAMLEEELVYKFPTLIRLV